MCETIYFYIFMYTWAKLICHLKRRKKVEKKKAIPIAKIVTANSFSFNRVQ